MKHGTTLLGLAAAGLVGALVAAGCGAAGVGLGSLGVALAAGAVYLFLAAGVASTGCSCGPRGPMACLSIAPVPQPDEDAGGTSSRVCLSIYVPPEDVGPPEEAGAVGPCLSQPCVESQLCLVIEPEPQICLEVEPAPQICLSDITVEGELTPGPCLDLPAPPRPGADGGAPIHPCLSIPPPVPQHVCLEAAPPPVPEQVCLSVAPPPEIVGAAAPPAAGDAAAARERLAASGVLTEGQARRLARLRAPT